MMKVTALENRPTSADSPATLREPTEEELFEDFHKGGRSLAACVHNCRVEGDGYCQHGNPSWLLELGFI